MRELTKIELPCVQCGKTGFLPGPGVNVPHELVLMRLVRNEHGTVGDWGTLWTSTLPCALVHSTPCLDPLFQDAGVVTRRHLDDLPCEGSVFGWQYYADRQYVMGWSVKRLVSKAYNLMVSLDDCTAPEKDRTAWARRWPAKKLAQRLGVAWRIFDL